MSKYDWSNVPSEVKWIATDESGFAHGYKSEPITGYLHRGFWYYASSANFVLFPSENPFKGHWRDSLEERPQ